MAGVSRIAEARRRAADAKQLAAVAAVAGFLAIALLARESHPATSNARSSPGNASTSDSSRSSDDDGFGFGSGSVAPSSGSQPQVHTSVS